jgi:aryl-alcohol dehydrogenase-like predicted oxidoreductase
MASTSSYSISRSAPPVERKGLATLAAHFGFADATGDARIAAFSSVASRWVLAHPHVSSVIPGFRNARQPTCNVAAGKRRSHVNVIRKPRGGPGL